MLRAIILLLATQTLAIPQRCPSQVSPVCGSDGKLYYNECYMKNRNVHGDVTAVDWADCQVDCDEPHACTLELSPRCGSDNRIYGNRCQFLWASCGKPAPIVEEPLSNCVNRLCPDNCEYNDKKCKAEVDKCRTPWKMFMTQDELLAATVMSVHEHYNARTLIYN